MVTIIALATTACTPVTSTRYEAVPLTSVKASGEMFRFDLVDGRQVDMVVQSMNYPHVHGYGSKLESLDVDLRQVKALAVVHTHKDQAATLIKYLVVGTAVTVAVVAGVFLLVLLTKSSCPFLYVDDGGRRVLVGEAYSGAAFRSIARDDLLPTPVPAGATMRAWLDNEAHETQYTDLLELVLVDHAPEVRPLSTFDARVIGVGPAQPPVAARDQDGQDVLAQIRVADDRSWETNMVEVSSRARPPLRETVDLTFAVGSSGPAGAPVLELTLGNTYWIDAVMGRFFALMGGRLDSYLEKGNDAAAGTKIRSWREREGLDLRVEVEIGGAYRPVAVIPTVGPMALRRVAVPLPPEVAMGELPGRPVHVRVGGGVGFWRIDEAALSRQVSQDAPLMRIAPSIARDAAGQDLRPALRATDGKSHILADRGQSLALSFALPPLDPGRRRTGFMLTHGYYNVHRPQQSDWSPLVLRDIRDRPGALAGFGLSLFRAYLATTTAEVRP